MHKVILSVFLVLSMIVGFFAGTQVRKDPQGGISIQVDTLYIRDTITAIEPVYITRKVVEQVAVPVTDTIRVNDTLFVHLDREQVVWTDSLCSVYASGIQTQVDSVIHYTTQTIIELIQTERVEVNPRWSVGITAGYGAGAQGLTPFVGVGITRNLFTFGYSRTR